MSSDYPTRRLGRPYLAAAAACLALGATFGMLSAIPHGWPSTLAQIPLQKIRPFHTTFAIAWIFLAYTGCLYHFLPEVCGGDWRFPYLARVQLWLLIAAGLVASGSYVAGHVTGREYLEFPFLTSALISAAWIIFLIHFFATVLQRPRPWPAYLWMWATGLVMFPVTFLEGHLYLLSRYGDHAVRDLAVQWKSYGSLIGSWNQVVYGLAAFLAERLSGNRRLGFSRVAFAFYWLSLLNLILGFAHHTYPLPQFPWVRRLSFGISMTEWVILIHLLWSGFSEGDPRGPTSIAAAFLSSSTFWVGVNLTLALLISVPHLNLLTHGTHVTMAHAMGSTIGINTMILWAVGTQALMGDAVAVSRGLRRALAAANISLAAFLISLLAAGAVKGRAMQDFGWSFFTAMESARPFLRLMATAGALLWLSILCVCVAWMRCLVGRRGPGILQPEEGNFRVPSWAFAAMSLALGSLPWWFPVRPDLPSPDVYRSESSGPRASRGHDVFVREACWKCHGRGLQGPDLDAVGPEGSNGWRRIKILHPTWSRGDSRMPGFQHLDANPEALEDLLAYLDGLRMPRASEAAVDLSSAPSRDAGMGRRLYESHCASCHGGDGRGDGPAARLLAGECAPRDFTRRQFRTRSGQTYPTAADLYRTLTLGMPGSAMPSFRHLPPADRWQLVYHIQRLAGLGDDVKPLAIPEALAETPERLERGRRLVDDLDCRACHGPGLRGLEAESNGFDWKDEAGRPVPRSTDLLRGVFKSGASPQDLYRTLFFGRSGSPMPSYDAALTDEEERWSLVCFLRHLQKTSP